MWSNAYGSIELAILIVLSFLATVVGGTHFLCDQNHTRPTATHCGSEETYLCQAVLDASLDVVCWECPDGIAVKWTVTYTSGQKVVLKPTSQTLHFAAWKVSSDVAGCYQCRCEVGEPPKLLGVNFSVKVAAGDKPRFTVPHDLWHKHVYQLLPYNRSVILNASDSGIVVVDCSATGYPDPTYSWQVTANGTDVGDSCNRVKDGGKKLNFIPTPFNTKEELLITCIVQNGLHDGIITGEQLINIDIRKWLLHPYPTQSGKKMYLSDGNATGVVAASEYGCVYHVCANMTAVTPADNPACKFDLYNYYEGKCCPCDASTCHPSLDLILNRVTVTDNEGLGLSTDGCSVTTSRKQRLLFFASRCQDDSSSMINHLIGITDVMPSPPASSISEKPIIDITVGVVLGAVVLSILLCTAAGAGYKYGKRGQIPEPSARPNSEDGENGSVGNATGRERQDAENRPRNYGSNGTTPPSEDRRENDVPTVTVQAGQEEHPLQPTAHRTIPNTFECTIPEGTIQAKRDYTVAINCGTQSVNVSFTAAKCSSLYNRVWRIHATLERGIHLDGKLLAQLSQRKLVAKKEFNDINANLQAHNNSAAGTRFVNSVLFQWLPDEFERNVSQLIEALESHEDRGNQNIARKLHKAYSESKQPLDLEPCHPNSGITADMPSLTVCAGPREHPLQLTPHSTVPNTFGCVIPEEIRLEAGNEYQFVVNYGNTSVNVTFSVAKCSSVESSTSRSLTISGKRGRALFEQVQKIQGELLTGLSLDETLFARLRENQLLTQEEGGVIIAHLRGHNYSAAGTYFVNSVLFRWTFEVFESNVRQLIEALQSHDDCENQSAAGKLQRALLECGLETHDLCPVAATTNGNS